MKQQPLLGFTFALITAMAWGSLPIALKQALSVMNAQTIVWYRFIVAAISLLALLAYKKKLPELMKVGQYAWLALIGVIGLTGNFLLFSSSLNYIEPSVAQIFYSFILFWNAYLWCTDLQRKIGAAPKDWTFLIVNWFRLIL